MQTNLAPKIQQSPHAEAIDTILRKCVHCGFCNATCPTYQIRGDELDGPRGRIYQMKQFFEGEPANAQMLKHLDRCLTCRACETTCPSGVQYSHLLEIGKESIEQELPRPWWDRARRWGIVRFINSGWLFALSIRMGQAFAWMLPSTLKESVPMRQVPVERINTAHARKVLMLAGCVQPALAPNTNACASNLLNRFEIEVIEVPGNLCCGAAALHTSEPKYAMGQVKKLIDSWWPHIEAGVEAVVVTATGCGVSVKDYGRLLANDPDYANKAKTVSSLYCDLIELVGAEVEQFQAGILPAKRVAVHTPCTMQHGLGINHRVEALLAKAGYEICEVEEAHLCCGSAGTYSMLQPTMAEQLRTNKIRALSVNQPDVIATANIGCQLHLAQSNKIPVVHWIELLQTAH
ncbi:MAG: glycolate oxidase subunit GlcF [Gammaproteobacteria bacterium]|nr:glycolate oxidase subunit GlcF [Gammaproteobacteria bacterium]MDH3858129.1 glycolate oxidase subunit GlcF [Gammaproteobacteria bacterium]